MISVLLQGRLVSFIDRTYREVCFVKMLNLKLPLALYTNLTSRKRKSYASSKKMMQR